MTQMLDIRRNRAPVSTLPITAPAVVAVTDHPRGHKEAAYIGRHERPTKSNGARIRSRFDHAAATGSMRVGSLFLTLPARALTGQQIMSSEG
jgi:hypothetical protein